MGCKLTGATTRQPMAGLTHLASSPSRYSQLCLLRPTSALGISSACTIMPITQQQQCLVLVENLNCLVGRAHTSIPAAPRPTQEPHSASTAQPLRHAKPSADPLSHAPQAAPHHTSCCRIPQTCFCCSEGAQTSGCALHAQAAPRQLPASQAPRCCTQCCRPSGVPADRPAGAAGQPDGPCPFSRCASPADA